MPAAVGGCGQGAVRGTVRALTANPSRALFRRQKPGFLPPASS